MTVAELTWPDVIHCHDYAHPPVRDHGVWVQQPGDRHVTCGYCGSVHPRDLYTAYVDVEPVPRASLDEPYPPDLPVTPDAVLAWHKDQSRQYVAWSGMSWADLKYGWPHKLYLYGANAPGIKFRSVHLADLDDATLAAVSGVIERHTGIRFEHRPEGLFWQATT